MYREGLGLGEETTRRIVVEVAEEEGRELAEFRSFGVESRPISFPS